MKSNPAASEMTEVLALLEELVSIGAPTFKEQKRSAFIERWLRERIDAPVGRDEPGNVWVDLSRGEGGEGALHLFDAHIDTVFPDETIAVKKEPGRWEAPGVLDDGAACALLMVWAAKMAKRAVSLPFLVSFSVREEGLGNLNGIREIVRRFGRRLKDGWMFDLRLNLACHEAVGSRRYKIAWQTAGGHSWSNYGRPNAIVEAAAWLATVKESHDWKPGVRTFNVGQIEGGTGINIIAATASLTLEARSIEPEFLAGFDRWLTAQNKPAQDDPDRSVAMEVTCIGERPAGSLSPDHPMVRLIREVHAELQIPLAFDAFGTNANALYEAGIPAVTTGLAAGAGCHTRTEHIELASLETGFEKLSLIAARLEAGPSGSLL